MFTFSSKKRIISVDIGRTVDQLANYLEGRSNDSLENITIKMNVDSMPGSMAFDLDVLMALYALERALLIAREAVVRQ